MRARLEEIDGADHLVTGPCPDVALTVLPPADGWLPEHHRQLRELTIDTAAGTAVEGRSSAPTLRPGRVDCSAISPRRSAFLHLPHHHRWRQ